MGQPYILYYMPLTIIGHRKLYHLPNIWFMFRSVCVEGDYLISPNVFVSGNVSGYWDMGMLIKGRFTLGDFCFRFHSRRAHLLVSQPVYHNDGRFPTAKPSFACLSHPPPKHHKEPFHKQLKPFPAEQDTYIFVSF